MSIMVDAKAKLKLSAQAGNVEHACARVMTSPQLASVLLVTVLIWEFSVLFLKARESFFGSTNSLHFMFQIFIQFPSSGRLSRQV
jgi:hypothetical protein